MPFQFGVPTLYSKRKATLLAALGESLVGPARSESLGTYGVSMRENREISWSPVGVDDAPSWMVRGVADRCLAGREGNAEAVIP
jgi:hypothetical protein